MTTSATDVREKIKARVKKLLNLAADDGAFDGEITAAMLAAEKLMDQYHLDRAEIDAAEQPENGPPPPPTMGKVEAGALWGYLSTWETALGNAVNELVGTTAWYRCGKRDFPSGPFKKPTRKACVVFYGPDEDAQIAAELFAEWGMTIATLATGKYGGCQMGDGAKYAYGFASALQQKAYDAQRRRREIVTPATTALVRVGTGSLAALNEQTRALAKKWLADEQGIKLGKASRGGGYRQGSHDAFQAGRADGARAEFTASRRAKLPG